MTTTTTGGASQMNPSNSGSVTPTRATTTASSLQSPLSALAKFNRIIDNTVPATNYYSTIGAATSAAPPSRLVGENAVAFNLNNSSGSSSSLQKQQQQQQQINNTTKTNEIKINNTCTYNNYYDCGTNNYSNYYNLSNDNQTKRNDVHYLLKQLNSFSDIEEIEIVDMKTVSQQQQQQKQNLNNSSNNIIKNNEKLYQTINNTRDCDQNNLIKQLPLQYDDYIFQSCHYLDSSCFATTITTAIAGISSSRSTSHEFRPSLYSTTSYDDRQVLQDQQNFVAPYSIPSTAPTINEAENIFPRRKKFNTQSCSSSNSPTASASTPAAPIPNANASSSVIYSTTSRITAGDVIQTELSSSTSLSAKINSKNSTASCSSDERRKPFFKCCYTPLDRWREKRMLASAAATAAVNGGGGGSIAMTETKSHVSSGGSKVNNHPKAGGVGDPV